MTLTVGGALVREKSEEPIGSPFSLRVRELTRSPRTQV